MESFHGETTSEWRGSHLTARERAVGGGAIPRRDSERMAREPSQGETASVQRIMMESTHGEIASVQRIVWIPVLTSDRACSGAAKPRSSVRRQSEGVTGQCGVSKVLGSSGVRAMGPKKYMYKNRLICKD